MDELKFLKVKPELKDRTGLQIRVMNRIAELDNNHRIHQQMIWWRLVAVIIVFLAVGSYSWMEMNTYLNRMQTFANMNDSFSRVTTEHDCIYQLNKLVNVLEEAGFIIDAQRNVIAFSRQDVVRLGNENSPLLSDIDQFLATMEIMYPLKYRQYSSGEAIVLNSWQLKNDQQLCKWIK